MLDELTIILAISSRSTSWGEIVENVVESNVLGKATASTRHKCIRHLRELYALDAANPVYSTLRKLHQHDASALPQLAVLTASYHDPLLEVTIPFVAGLEEGATLGSSDFDTVIGEAFPDTYNPNIQNKIARNVSSSWTQAGFLEGRQRKVRVKPDIKPAATTMALYLGTLQGVAGRALFKTPWAQVLDVSPIETKRLAEDAHRAGLINFMAAGEVIEISFPTLHVPDLDNEPNRSTA
jgi:hypothetical protein